jgi:hypothetical protein
MVIEDTPHEPFGLKQLRVIAELSLFQQGCSPNCISPSRPHRHGTFLEAVKVDLIGIDGPPFSIGMQTQPVTHFLQQSELIASQRRLQVSTPLKRLQRLEAQSEYPCMRILNRQ